MVNINICENVLSYYPIDGFIRGTPNDIGIIMFICGVTNVGMCILTIGWIKSQEFRAQEGSNEAVKSVIFPVFVNVLWMSAFASIYAGIVVSLIPIDPIAGNTLIASICYSVWWAAQHSVIEGIAFLLMQKGCGKHAAWTAGKWTFVWCIFTFSIMMVIFSQGGLLADLLELLWDSMMLVLYGCLWLAPSRNLFRRPAAIIYGKFWFLFRIAAFIINVLFFFPITENAGACGYILFSLLLFAIFQPLICYWTLLQDSKWWQGIDINLGGRVASYEDIRSPLLGTDFSLSSAQSLADTMDEMRIHNQVKMLNFACIKLDLSKPLGSGSFSKVYRGAYRNQECAIKLIYTVDLTIDVIKRVSAEASILSSIRHANVVNILGVSVLPPSVCLILELCLFGSLSDLIRGYGFDWSPVKKAPFTLTLTDKVYLALGCARGLAAVHAYDKTMCHRDVKSFNFLVDSQLNAKIADLELGYNSLAPGQAAGAVESDEESAAGAGAGGSSQDERSDGGRVVVEELLANWMAPEVLRNKYYQQPSDVYSLAIVLWEIISGSLPFDNCTQVEVRQKILSGFRHTIPQEFNDSEFGQLIGRAWADDPKDRPKAVEIVIQLEIMLQTCCYRHVFDADSPPDIAPILDYYEVQCYLRQNSRARSLAMSDQSALSDLPATGHAAVRMSASSLGRLSLQSPQTNRLSQSTLAKHVGSAGGTGAGAGAVAGAGQSQGTKQLAMSVQMPRAAQDLLNQIQDLKAWNSLEDTGECWAIFSSQYPYILLHGTVSFNNLFGFEALHTTLTIRAFQDLVKVYDTDPHRAGASAPIDDTTSGRMKSWGVGSESYRYLNSSSSHASKLASYAGASSKFLCMLSETSEGNAVVPMARRMGCIDNTFLCSLHAFPIYPSSRSTSCSAASVSMSALSSAAAAGGPVSDVGVSSPIMSMTAPVSIPAAATATDKIEIEAAAHSQAELSGSVATAQGRTVSYTPSGKFLRNLSASLTMRNSDRPSMSSLGVPVMAPQHQQQQTNRDSLTGAAMSSSTRFSLDSARNTEGTGQVTINNNNTASSPTAAYIAILFNELKEQQINTHSHTTRFTSGGAVLSGAGAFFTGGGGGGSGSGSGSASASHSAGGTSTGTPAGSANSTGGGTPNSVKSNTSSGSGITIFKKLFG